jgi:hypothetical protein
LEELSNLPPTAWVLIVTAAAVGFAISWLWRWYRNYSARDVQGNIFGGDQMAEWTVMDGPRRFTFTNPQSSLYDRIAAVKAVAGEVPVEGRIVFTRRGKFPKGLPKWTLMVDSLRAEFPSVDYDSGALVRYHEPWQKLKGSVKPSYMAHMR